MTFLGFIYNDLLPALFQFVSLAIGYSSSSHLPLLLTFKVYGFFS